MFSLIRNCVCKSPDLRFFKYPSLVTFISIHSTNTCGFPQDKAIIAPKTTQFESSPKPDSVITFFRDNGFSDSRITGVIPQLLRCSIDKSLKPKFVYFKSQGITGSDFIELVCRNPNILKASLEKKIIPNFDLLRNIVLTDAKLFSMLKRSHRIIMQCPQKNMLPNVALLREQGVPADNIANFLSAQPCTVLLQTSRFRVIIEEVKHMQFDPSQYKFLAAVHALASMARSSFEAKFDAYRSWGLSEDELQILFRKNPYCLMISGKNIMSTMSYFVNEMGCSPSLIANHPNVPGLSLEKRIIPRCSLIQILRARGFVQKYSIVIYD